MKKPTGRSEVELSTIRTVGYFLAEALYIAGDTVLAFTEAVLTGKVDTKTLAFEEIAKVAKQRRTLRRSPVDEDASAEEVRDILANIVNDLDDDIDA